MPAGCATQEELAVLTQPRSGKGHSDRAAAQALDTVLLKTDKCRSAPSAPVGSGQHRWMELTQHRLLCDQPGFNRGKLTHMVTREERLVLIGQTHRKSFIYISIPTAIMLTNIKVVN